jgi:hypothetical protein
MNAFYASTNGLIELMVMMDQPPIGVANVKHAIGMKER